MTASPGDWIVTGVKGEKYPCKHDIFMMTYEPEYVYGPGRCYFCGAPSKHEIRIFEDQLTEMCCSCFGNVIGPDAAMVCISDGEM